jgi:hypothetical protein
MFTTLLALRATTYTTSLEHYVLRALSLYVSHFAAVRGQCVHQVYLTLALYVYYFPIISCQLLHVMPSRVLLPSWWMLVHVLYQIFILTTLLL